MDLDLHTPRKRKARDTDAERRNRRLMRARKHADLPHLPDHIRKSLMLKGLARPADSVRGQLLTAVLSGATQEPDGRWVFHGSIRELADGGLADGKRHDKGYLLDCMRAFVAQGTLTRLGGQHGKALVYAIQT